MLDKNQVIVYSSFGEYPKELFYMRQLLNETPILLHIKKDPSHPDIYRELRHDFPGRVKMHKPFTDGQLHGLEHGKSASFHRWEEVEENYDKVDYFFLSPFFNSISKQGYQANSDLWDKNSIVKYADKLVALGGLEPSNMDQLKDMGVKHVSLLGYVWGGNNPLDRVSEIIKVLESNDL